MHGLDEVEADLERLSDGAFLAKIEAVAAPATVLLTPPEQISTTECAARYRYIPDKEGTGATLWDPELTPYINKIQDLLDHPEVKVVVVPKPGRVGGTEAAANHLFKRLKFGPLTDLLWYMPSDSEVDAHVRRHVKKMFELHPEVRAKVGKGKTDDTMAFKVVAGRLLEWLQLNARTVTNRDAGLIVGDEIDAMNTKLLATFLEQVRIRGTTAGASFKGYLCSHMDKGWTTGIASFWKESNRGIWYWPCPHCNGFSSPCPTAPKGFDMRLTYERPSGVSDDELLDIVENTAGLLCPHCQRRMADAHKAAMNAGGDFVFAGQVISREGRVEGDPTSMALSGTWIHGTMSPWVPIGNLARRLVAATLIFERTKKPATLREVTAKVLGEVYEGAGSGGRALDPVRLAERAAENEQPPMGVVPDGFLFVTASVDVGGSKFDVLWEAWDLEGRSHKVKRRTIRQRPVLVAGTVQLRDIRTAERQDDWLVLRDEVLKPLLPLESDPTMGLPVAAMTIDTGDGHVTWKAREFARQMAREGVHWGKRPPVWQRVRLIKGSKTPTAPELPVKPREVNVDETGRKVTPSVLEYDLGVHKLKELVLERLAESEGAPGQVTFASDMPASAFAELAGEVLIDGSFERRGPNEMLDLSAYGEAARQMLMPERDGIFWEPVDRRPIWARPGRIADQEEIEAAAAQPGPPRQSPIDRLAALNRR